MKTYSHVVQKIMLTLFAARSLGSAGFIISGTVGVIVTVQLTGNTAWAGVPSAVKQIGVALASLGMGFLIDRIGQRIGFSLGLLASFLGAGLSALAIIRSEFLLYIVGALLIGIGMAVLQLSRFAAAEVNPPEKRGRAVSYIILAGTVGAIIGPLMAGKSGNWVLEFGVDELAGPFIASMALLFVAALAIFVGLRPEPRSVGRLLNGNISKAEGGQETSRPTKKILGTPIVIIAMSSMIVGQIVMVFLMGITSLHMKNNGYTLTDISLVISAHTFGMFALSILAGRLTDQWGRCQVIICGTVILILAGILAPLSSAVLPLAVALFLLGLGWNFCFVAGSALLTDQLSSSERAKTQGTNDLILGITTAVASICSGFVYANTSFTYMGHIAVILSLIPLLLSSWWLVRNHRIKGLFSSLQPSKSST